MNFGKFDRKIKIERNTAAENDFNEQYPEGWETVIELWTKYTSKSGGESFEGDELVFSQTGIFTTRYSSEVTTEMRINDNETFYDILDIEIVGRYKYMNITAKRKDNQS